MKQQVEKPRVATVHSAYESEYKKLTLTIPSKFSYKDTVVMSHESLSVLRKWCDANNYRLDESKLVKPKKAPQGEVSDEELYTYR